MRIAFALAAAAFMSGCGTAPGQSEAELQATVDKIKTYQAQPARPIPAVIAEFEKRCAAMFASRGGNPDQVAQAMGLSAPALRTPSTRKRSPKTFYFGPTEPSMAFLLPDAGGVVNGCQIVANSADPVADAATLRDHYGNGSDEPLEALTSKGAVRALGYRADVLGDEKLVFIEQREARNTAVILTMYDPDDFGL